MRSSSGLLLLAALLASLSAPAQADFPLLRALVTGDSTFLMEGFDLSKRDRNLAMESQAALLADPSAGPGAQVEWSNAQDGSAGAVFLVKAFEYDGLPCRRLLHRFEHKGQADPVYLHLTRCQVPDGSWKTL